MERERRRLFVLSWLVGCLVLLSFVAGVGGQRFLAQRMAAHNRPLPVFWEAWEALEKSYYGELPDPQQRTYGAIRGVLALLGDPYTIFLEPQPAGMEQERLAGAYGGIGVELWRNSADQVILSPYPGSPAEAAGVQLEDILLAVDGRSVFNESLETIETWLRGDVGTTVQLTVSRPPTPPFELVIARAEICVPSVTYRVLDSHPTIGYVHVTTFTERTSQEAAEALDRLRAAGISCIVLDLRGNGGGLLRPAVGVADLFLDGGVVLYEQRQGGEEVALSAQAGGQAVDLPLAVLVNGSTASAAEIVAGAIQARERGVLIGEPTFGKGSVQLIYPLSDGSSLHVTSAVWLLPNRQPVSTAGLTPDVLLAQTDEMEDVQLERAVQYLLIGEQ